MTEITTIENADQTYTVEEISAWGSNRTFRKPKGAEVTEGVWMLFEEPTDEEADMIANLYTTKDEESWWVGAEHTAVGLVSYYGPFPSRAAATMWLEDECFEDYTA